LKKLLFYGLAGVFIAAGSLLADPIQVTGGVNGICSANCDASPNLLGNGSDIGIYIPSGTATAAEELLVLLVPNDTTNLFTTDPLGTINVYNPFPGSKTGTGTSQFGTVADAHATFGLGGGTLTNVADGFWGDIVSNSGSDKVGDFLGIGLSSSINMSNVAGFDASLSPAINTKTFGVYTFLITASLDSKGLLDISIPGGLPTGTVAAVVTDTGLANPWSSAGGVNSPVPEPSSLAWLGLASLAVVLVARKRKAASSLN